MNANRKWTSESRMIVASILVVSMFLLASVAVMAPTSVGDAKNDAKELDTLIVKKDTVTSDKWEEGVDYEIEKKNPGEPTIILKGGEYICKKSVLIDFQLDEAKVKVETGKVFSVQFQSENDDLISMKAQKNLKILGDGEFDLFGLSNGYCINAIEKIEIGEKEVSPTILTDGSMKSGSITNPPAKETEFKMENGIVNITGCSNTAIAAVKINLNGGYLLIDVDVTGLDCKKLKVESAALFVDAKQCLNGEFEFPKAESNPGEEKKAYMYFSATDQAFSNETTMPTKYTTLISEDGEVWTKTTTAVATTEKHVTVGIESTKKITVTSSDPEKGSVEIKRLAKWNGGPAGTEPVFFSNEPITIVAVANDGYQFLKWDDVTDVNPRLVLVTESDTLKCDYEATFIIEIPEQRDIETDASETGTADIKVTDDARSITVDFAQGSYVYINDMTKLKGHTVTISLHKQAVGDRFDFEAKFTDTGEEIETPIMVTLPYDKTMGGFPSAYYYPEVGEPVKMSSMIDETNGTVSFITTHNSVYGVEYVSDEPTVVGTDNSWVPIVVIIVFSLLGVLVVAWKKD